MNGYDYTNPGAYLVTICTRSKERLFGDISSDGVMTINIRGEIVKEEWLRTAALRTNVELDEYVIMPDHFHGIVVLKSSDCLESQEQTDTCCWK